MSWAPPGVGPGVRTHEQGLSEPSALLPGLGFDPEISVLGKRIGARVYHTKKFVFGGLCIHCLPPPPFWGPRDGRGYACPRHCFAVADLGRCCGPRAVVGHRHAAEFIDAREKAPAAATSHMFYNNKEAAIHGGLGIGIPGELQGLEMAFRRHGSGAVPWKDLVMPAAGVPMSRTGAPRRCTCASMVLGASAR